ncbi:hypothetical protein VP1G_03666 [Cytospora mali]|uniref:Acyltransferase 3 domain-containing protein n=1 Tax=Cytospora mali TaxID=578113 RepID=A0A194UXF5_CYTMA|nr:hypothetical protein VP1G_03666 [Valsa mali var. pyri (nom. inval.)]
MAIGREGNVKWVDISAYIAPEQIVNLDHLHNIWDPPAVVSCGDILYFNVLGAIGLRGIASALVVTTHLARAWDGELFGSTSSEDAPPRLLQLPYLRILIQGRIGVTIFAFVTGYVCALKPIKLCRQGNQEAALASISKSALRRIPRLVLPAAAATAVSWVMAEMGLYAVAKHQDSWWIDVQSSRRIPYLGEAFGNLVYNVVTTWTRSTNEYDNNQWTLLPLLKGSIWLCLIFLAAFGMQFFWGTLIADMQNHPPTTQIIADRPRLCRVLSFMLVFIGLTFSSFPEGHAEWMTWSRILLKIMKPILPDNPDFPRFGSGIGLELIALGILLSPWLQKVLSSRYLLFLGRMSFAVYLLHGPLMKSTLVWMLYGIQVLPDHENDQGEMVITRLKYPGNMTLIAWQLVWLPMVYGIAHLWMAHVDPWCDRMTNRLVEYVRLEASEKPSILPPR